MTKHFTGTPWQRAFQNINGRVIQIKRKHLKASLLQLEVYSIYFDVLDMLAKYEKEYVVASSKRVLAEEFNSQMEFVCNALCVNISKMSRQMQMDIGNELKRLHAIIQLAKILSNDVYIASRTNSEVASAEQAARREIFIWGVYVDEMALAALKQFENAVNISGVVSEQERQLIVKAIGLKAGHWFKCPNGHYYCIGECGGAMQESKCIECKESVGGSRHKLLPNNQLAREMDGARYAAWSDTANNMRNFEL